ncbi:kinase-like protein [Thelephora ganbajun]|uniref:Kinase-like protein n=1 Tax=Thelephora ganbajun TaxID=370292 RepID=A0ACB6Z761_THEGA|nr:kinase-like protein [Thelephora ganbajun]
MCRRFKTIPDSMRIENCLGGPMDEEYEGGCATVFRGKYRGHPVAIKTVRLYLTSNLEECFNKFRREVVAWRHLRHPHILPLIGVILERHRFAMVSKWMDHGNINEFIKNNKGANRVQLLIDAANGLEYVHSINMVHGDLKGANILINQGLRACLVDFGLSTIVGVERRAAANASSILVASKESLMSFTAGGTVRWMSPELLDPDRFGITDDRPTKKSDCYALGMVMYEVCADTTVPTFAMVQPIHCQVLCGNAPYCEITNEGALINTIMRGDRPQKPKGAEDLGFTKGLWEIIQRCWLADASERPDVKDVLFQLNYAEWSWNRKRSI